MSQQFFRVQFYKQNYPLQCLIAYFSSILEEVKELVKDSSTKERRSLVPEETLEQQIGPGGTNSPPVLPEPITSSFESSHGPPLVTNDGLTEALKEAFSLNGIPPTIEDFETSIKNLAEKKQEFGLI